MYQQGDIVAVNFPFTNIAKSKKRPALIISNKKINQTGDYLLIQITSKIKHDGLSFPILDEHYKSDKLPLTSFIRLHKIFLLNESLIIDKITSVKQSFYRKLINTIFELLKS